MAAQPTVQQVSIAEPVSIIGIFYSVKPLIVYPARWLSILLLLSLRPLVIALRWLSWPFISLARSIWGLATFPIALLLKFEAFLTFLSVAVIIGAFAGFVLHTTSSVTHKVLGIEHSEHDNLLLDIHTEDEAVRSVADFREARKARKQQHQQTKTRKQKLIHSPREEKMFLDLLSRSDYKSGASDSGAQSRLSLSKQTILEEDDSSSFDAT